MSRKKPRSFRLWYKRLKQLEKKRLFGNRIIGPKGCYIEHWREGLSPEDMLSSEISYSDWEPIR